MDSWKDNLDTSTLDLVTIENVGPAYSQKVQKARNKGLPANFAVRTARKEMIAALTDKGVPTHDAVYILHKLGI